MLNNYEDLAVLIDFDGTITDKDTNVELFNQKNILKKSINDLSGNKESKEMSTVDKMNFIFDYIKMTEDEYKDFILNSFEITPGFKEFAQILAEKDIPMAIVSGGFINGIEVFLDKHDMNNIKIYAHRLIFDGEDISVDFYGDPDDCCENGPCGNCKIMRYNEYKKEKEKVVFIGDGFTDRWVAKKADILFAKSDLVDFCKKDGVDYIEWEDFYDIKKVIFG